MSRFLLNQFAEDANNNGVFGSYSAGNATTTNDTDEIQSLDAYKKGWSEATTNASILPCLEEMQGLQYLFCKSIKQLYKQGIPEWLAGEEYEKNSFVTYNGLLYKNITGIYTEKSPDLDLINWEEFKSSSGGLPLGSIFNSLVPQSSTAFHILDGSVLSKVDYESFYNYMNHIKSKVPNLFYTNEQYEEELSRLGVCNKFVLDDLSIRIPYINKISFEVDNDVEATTVINKHGDFKGVDFSKETTDITSGDALTNDAALWIKTNGNSRNAWVKINDVEIFNSYWNATYGSPDNSFLYYAKKGDIITYTGLTHLKVFELTDDVTDVLKTTTCYCYIVIANDNQEENISEVENYKVNNTVPMGACIYSDHILTDLNYCLSDGKWKDGNLYVSYYDYLVNQYNNASDTTETIGDIEITYRITEDKLYISTDDTLVTSVYEKYNRVFYVLDIENKQFKFPLNNSRLIVERIDDEENNKHYILYSDGYCEQWGVGIATQAMVSGETINFIKPFKDTNYALFCINHQNITSAYSNRFGYNKTETGFTVVNNINIPYSWRAEGYVNTNLMNSSKYLYYKVANTTNNIEYINVSQLINKINKLENNWVIDYTTGVTITNNFEVPTNGWLIGYGLGDNGSVSVNNIVVGFRQGSTGSEYGINGVVAGICVPLNKGDIITYNCNVANLKFYTTKTN